MQNFSTGWWCLAIHSNLLLSTSSQLPFFGKDSFPFTFFLTYASWWCYPDWWICFAILVAGAFSAYTSYLNMMELIILHYFWFTEPAINSGLFFSSICFSRAFLHKSFLKVTSLFSSSGFVIVWHSSSDYSLMESIHLYISGDIFEFYNPVSALAILI